MSKEHIEVSLEKVRSIFKKASDRIEGLKIGEKIPATVLAEEVAKDFKMTGAQAYPILKILFNDYPGVEVKRGAKGGILKVENIAPKKDFIDEEKVMPIINT